MSVYRPEFEAALRAFARVSERMGRGGYGAPILVGGAAVELYSNSAIATGDPSAGSGQASMSPPRGRTSSKRR